MAEGDPHLQEQVSAQEQGLLPQQQIAVKDMNLNANKLSSSEQMMQSLFGPSKQSSDHVA